MNSKRTTSHLFSFDTRAFNKNFLGFNRSFSLEEKNNKKTVKLSFIAQFF